MHLRPRTARLDVYLLGAGDHAYELYELLSRRADLSRSVIRAADLDTKAFGSPARNVPFEIVNEQRLLIGQEPFLVIPATGNAQNRSLLFKRFSCVPHAKWLSHHHASAVISPSATVNDGTYLASGVVVSSLSTVGPGVLINWNTTVGHHARIGVGAVLCPGVNIGGHVSIEEGASVGSGAQVLPGRTVGARSKVGAGAVVTADVPPDTTVVGVPARARRAHG